MASPKGAISEVSSDIFLFLWVAGSFKSAAPPGRSALPRPSSQTYYTDRSSAKEKEEREEEVFLKGYQLV